MKIVFMFLIQALVVGGLIKLVARMFIPRPIRTLFKVLIRRSSATLANDALGFIENVKKDVNENSDLDFDDYPNVIEFKSKVK